MDEYVLISCPTCGGNIKILDYKKRYNCDYCGNEIIIRSGSNLDQSITKLAITSLSDQINDLNRDKQLTYKQLLFYERKISSVRNGGVFKFFSLISFSIFWVLILLFFIIPALTNMGLGSGAYIILELAKPAIFNAIPGSKFLLWFILLTSFIAFIIGLVKYSYISQIDVNELQTEKEKSKAYLDLLINETTKKQEELNSFREIARYK